MTLFFFDAVYYTHLSISGRKEKVEVILITSTWLKDLKNYRLSRIYFFCLGNQGIKELVDSTYSRYPGLASKDFSNRATPETRVSR